MTSSRVVEDLEPELQLKARVAEVVTGNRFLKVLCCLVFPPLEVDQETISKSIADFCCYSQVILFARNPLVSHPPGDAERQQHRAR